MAYEHETVSTLSAKFRDGTTTAVRESAAARQAAREAGPVFITITEDDSAAATSDERLQAGTPRSLLEGIPVAIKDVIDTAGMYTTMGSNLFIDNIPDEDATIVKQLREAGANIIGKTNTHEFSYGIRGDASAYGVVPNPHDESRIAGGSSSGSAAAVARGIVSVAVGTDTAGSIRVPAALCGAVGFKPTFDILSTDGIFPLAKSFDTTGFLGTSVRDISLTLDALGLEGFSPTSDHADDLVLRRLQDNPALPAELPDEDEIQTIPDVIDAPDIFHPSFDGSTADFRTLFNTIRSREAYVLHKPYLASESTRSQYQPLTLERLDGDADSTDEEAEYALTRIQEIGERYLEEFADVDILLTPTVPIDAPPRDEEPGEGSEVLVSLSVAWNVLGWPALTIPYWNPGDPLPKSVQVIGKPGRDADVLRAGQHLEALLAKQNQILSAS
ncbi:amidase [Yaniella flava]|uniref:Amidase n=1 Tax=Yaniella flava TaxID=287930 RepID=A0ABP5GH32_9MICC